MPTRLFTQDVAAAISPTTKGSYGATGSALDRKLAPEKSGSADSLTLSVAGTETLFYRFVSNALSSNHSFSGTITVTLMASSAAGPLNTLGMHAYVTQGDSTTLTRGTLFSEAALTGIALTTSDAGDSSNALTLSGVSAQTGDRVVVEIFGDRSVAGSANTTVYRGGSGTDLASGDTDTTRPGWVEFSQDSVPFLPSSVSEEADLSVGVITATGIAATGRVHAGATLALGSLTVTGIALTVARAAVSAALGHDPVTATGITAVARLSESAGLDPASVDLDGLAVEALASVVAALSAASQIDLIGTDVQTQITGESGDIFALMTRGIVTVAGLPLSGVSVGTAVQVATGLLEEIGIAGIGRSGDTVSISLGSVAETGKVVGGTFSQVAVLQRGVVVLQDGGVSLFRAGVLAALGQGQIVVQGTPLNGRIGFRYSQFSIV